MCRTNGGIEDTEHFLLLCPSFDIQRRHLLAGVSVLLRLFVEINSLPSEFLVQILLYGVKNLSNEINKSIIELTLYFIYNTGRCEDRYEKFVCSTQAVSPFLFCFIVHLYTPVSHWMLGIQLSSL